MMIDGTPISVNCSIPFRFLQDSNLREQLKSSGFNVGGRHGKSLLAATNSAPTLTYWIFHPSYRNDPRKCLFNYHHVMQEKNRVASFMQVAVVRSGNFEAYRSAWGKVLAIFQLPAKLPNCDRGPDKGGVGYSRLFIQKMAYGLNLEYVFVIDDNVATMREAQFSFGEQTEFSLTVSRMEDGRMKMQRCSFLKALVHLQKIAEGKVNPTDVGKEYEPHQLKEQFEAQNCPLYSYTGPAKLFGNKQDSYGVLGLLRSVPTVRRPFSKTQVYALVLLNVKSTVEKGVFYRPWPCWEDLRINDDCDKAGLWVVKCNRYCFYKLQYKDWINNLALPRIYMWNEESRLEERSLESELPKDLEKSVILAHLRNLVDTEGPSNCFKGEIEGTGPEDGHTNTKGAVDIDGRGFSRSADCPVGIVEQLEIEKTVKKSSDVQVLILSYDYSSTLPFESIFLLNESYCSATEKIVFVVSAKQLQETRKLKGGLTLADVRGGSFFHFFSTEMSKKNGNVAIFSAADPGRHSLRWILIDVSFSKQELREENNSNRTSERSSAKQGTIERPESAASKNPEEGIEIDPRGSKRSAERYVEDLKQNKRPLTADQIEHPNVQGVNSDSNKVASGQKMTPKTEKDQETSQGNNPDRSKRSPYSETTAGKKPRIEGCVRDGRNKSTSEQMDVRHDTPGLSANVSAKSTELLSSAAYGSSGRDKKTSSKERESVRSQVTGLTSDDPAYDEGTNTVTSTIVKLWREKVKQRGEKDLPKETVKKELVFEPKELEKLDGKGFNALTKACSLPSVGIGLVSHLLNIKRIDVNSRIPRSFNWDSPAAIWLTPGMSALSVAIRRGNVRCVHTFMNRETEIDLRSTDGDQNTALHHCVLSSDVSKTAFDRLFPCYRVLEWKEMKNGQDKSPLDIARERWRESDTNNDEKKKEALEYVLNKMDPGGH